MVGKIFLSCGQSTSQEKQVANKIKKLLEDKFDLDCYVAINIQSLNEIMKITDELKSSDYFLFIDFFRKDKDIPCSLFSHQELALAYHLGFKDIIAFKEEGAPSEGFIKYVQSNPEPFKTEEGLLEKIESFIKQRGWNKNYSRNLIVDHIEKFKFPIIYSDHTGPHKENIWHTFIHNRRPDIAAVNTMCILDYIELPDGTKENCYDRSYLKWATQLGYQKTIFPEDYGIIDIFAIREEPPGIYLHSQWDMIVKDPVVKKDGKHRLHYKVFSAGFPLLKFCVEVDYKSKNITQAKLIK